MEMMRMAMMMEMVAMMMDKMSLSAKTSPLAWIWIFMNIFQCLSCSEIQSSSFEYRISRGGGMQIKTIPKDAKILRRSKYQNN